MNRFCNHRVEDAPCILNRCWAFRPFPPFNLLGARGLHRARHLPRRVRSLLSYLTNNPEATS